MWGDFLKKGSSWKLWGEWGCEYSLKKKGRFAPRGEAGNGLSDDPDAGVDRGELDRGLRDDGLAGAAGAEVEGRSCVGKS